MSQWFTGTERRKRPIRLSSPSQKISRGVLPAVHFPLPRSVLVLNDSSNATLHQSKRPMGALSQSKGLHFRKEYSDIKSCYTTCLSQWSPTSSLPFCPSAPPDARKRHYISASVSLPFPFIISYSFFLSEDLHAFICISDPYHHSNGRLWQGCHFKGQPLTFMAFNSHPAWYFLESWAFQTWVNTMGDQILVWGPGPATEPVHDQRSVVNVVKVPISLGSAG